MCHQPLSRSSALAAANNASSLRLPRVGAEICMSDRSTRRSLPEPVNPDFAIVGAPKCGTTALYSYLDGHPGIAMSRSKEPVFWSRDLATPEPLSRADYDALWNGAPAGALRGEASTRYLRSDVAIEAIQ